MQKQKAFKNALVHLTEMSDTLRLLRGTMVLADLMDEIRANTDAVAREMNALYNTLKHLQKEHTS